MRSMITLAALCGFAIYFSATSLGQAPKPRFFSDPSGKFRVKAIVMDATDTSVKLKKEDGQEIDVPLDKLSDRDQQYIRELLAKYKAMVGDFPIGTVVQIKSGSRWYPGKVLQVQPGKYFVGFDDYSDSWNKWVTATELQLPADEVAPPATPEPTSIASATGSQPMATASGVNPNETSPVSPPSSAIVSLRLELMPDSPPPYEQRFIETRRFATPTADMGWTALPITPGPSFGDMTFQFEPSTESTLDLRFLPSVHRSRALVQNAGEWLAIDLTSGEVLWRLPPLRGTGLTPLALSDDGQRLVCSVTTDASKPIGLCVYEIEGREAKILWRWRPVPDSHEVKSVRFAYWLTNDRVAIQDEGGLAVWMPETQSQHAIISYVSEVPVGISPAGDFIAVPSLNNITVYHTDGVRPIARSQPVRHTTSSVDFSPTGKTILIAGDGKLSLLSSATGEVTLIDGFTIPIARAEWIDDDLLLIDGKTIYSLSRKKPVWELNLVRGKAVVGTAWTLLGKLVIADIPHSRLLTRSLAEVADVNAMNDQTKDLAPVRPGIKVAIKFGGNAIDAHRDAIQTHLREMISGNGWIEDPKAEVVLEANVNSVSESLQYETKGLFSKGDETVTVNYFTYNLSVLNGAEVLTRRSFRTLAESIGIIPKGKSLQQYVNERSEFDPRRLKKISIPATISATVAEAKIGSTDVWTIP